MTRGAPDSSPEVHFAGATPGAVLFCSRNRTAGPVLQGGAATGPGGGSRGKQGFCGAVRPIPLPGFGPDKITNLPAQIQS